MTTVNLESRAAAYISKIHAVSGQSGHRTTFSVACKLREFGLPFERAETILSQWNETNCQPKWTAANLRHKLIDAWRHTTPKAEYQSRSQQGIVTPRPLPAPDQSRPCVTNQADSSNESAQLAATIKAMSNDRPASSSKTTITNDICTGIANRFSKIFVLQKAKWLAQSRGISSEAVMQAYGRGLVRFVNHNWKPSWVVLDRSLRVASARRIDGLPWNQGTPNECKAMMLRGSQAKWPIGIREAKDYGKILLCEGGPDLLAAFHLILGRAAEFAPVSMLSASCLIHTDALRLFTSKRVRIYAHNDSAGQSAAQKWASQIKHRADVDIFSLAHYGVKDLNEFARSNFNAKDILP